MRKTQRKTTSSSRRRKRSSRERPLEKKKTKFNQLLSLIFNLLYYLLVVSIILGSFLFVANKDSNKSFFGYRFYNVLTDSMTPQKDSLPGGFRSGDITIVQMATFDQVKATDIITFRVGEDGFLTHRLVEKLSELNGEEGKFMITKGDANKSQDPPVSGERMIGKVVFIIPFMGSFLNFLRAHFVVSLVFVCSLFGFIWILRFYFEVPEQEVVRRRRSKSRSR